VTIKEVDNGFIVTISGTLRSDGETVYTSVEEVKMLEKISEVLYRKVDIKAK
jgi:hypothetical protein